MNTKCRILLSCLFLLLKTFPAKADNYPKNLNIDVLHYKFELKLSDENDQIYGRTSMRIFFKKDGLDNLRFDLVNQTEALLGKGMIVDSVYEMAAKTSFTHTNNELWIKLSKPSTANAETQLIIAYHGIPADGLRIGATRYGDRSFFNENWPNRARHWLPTIDHPYEKATSEFLVNAPNHYQVVSNGLLMEETNLDATTKLTHWKQNVPVSSWLYVLGVAEFAVQYVGWFDGKSIQTWVYNKDHEAGFYDFAEPTKQVMGFFSDYVGPYVYEKIANVQTPSVKGGMETSSAIFYGEELVDGKRSTRLRNVVIHELAHQWFGNAVTESTWDDAWLSEGFATYFTMLFIEHAYGREEFVNQLLAARKTTYAALAKDPGYKIIDDRSPEKAPVTSGLTYQKGAWILHMLRKMMGDQAFNAGIRDYYQRFMNGNATTTDFRLAMERASGKNLQPFFNQWLYQGGYIAMKGSWKYDAASKMVKISLQQTQPSSYNFDFSIEVGLYKTGDLLPEISVHPVSSRTIELSIPAATKPEKVQLDPQTVLLASWEFEEAKPLNPTKK
ncbi:M1 family aminopeptidase [Haliscomenobacter sp.]|uniref:M1 family metallopeptidase n=1 Tax=Haliscomenobacter sp. TaxID=2717303 RepID=UPI003364D695